MLKRWQSSQAKYGLNVCSCSYYAQTDLHVVLISPSQTEIMHADLAATFPCYYACTCNVPSKPAFNEN